jgi:hypothetical protein
MLTFTAFQTDQEQFKLQPNITTQSSPMLMSSMDATPKATNYLNFDINQLQESLVVLPPYKDDISRQWVRGYLKLKNNLSPTGVQDFILTGPKLRVTYGGCSWNKIIFNMDDEVADFRAFLNQTSSIVRNHIKSAPGKYKPGALTDSRFSWDDSMLIKQSREPDKYPDELRCRLSTFRDMIAASSDDGNNDSKNIDIVDTYLFKKADDSTVFPLAPDEVAAGDNVIPVFRVSYGRNVDRFFLILTLLKAQVIPNEKPVYKKISNDEWEMDIC